MKKAVVLILAMSLTITLFTVTPARANRFWPGVAIGVGSAIVLGSLLYSPRAYYPDSRPVRVYSSPVYYPPSSGLPGTLDTGALGGTGWALWPLRTILDTGS